MNTVTDYLNIQEAFTVRDSAVLTELCKSVAHKDVIFVEVGSWKGFSTYYIGLVAKECGGQVYAIDHWKGSPGVPEHKLTIDCFDIFRTNMKKLGLDEVVHPLVMNSLDAVRIFDKVADLVFIDGDHRYECISKDVSTWFEKVKPGGILCGHDCENYYRLYPDDIKGEIDKSMEDFNQMARCHAGVVRTLHEQFGYKYMIHKPTTVWSVKK
jgi:predicted O-methyltransferase YrrM